MNKVYNSILTFPKQELAKINYNLLSRYLTFDSASNTEAIIQKLIKRIVSYIII